MSILEKRMIIDLLLPNHSGSHSTLTFSCLQSVAVSRSSLKWAVSWSIWLMSPLGLALSECMAAVGFDDSQVAAGTAELSDKFSRQDQSSLTSAASSNSAPKIAAISHRSYSPREALVNETDKSFVPALVIWVIAYLIAMGVTLFWTIRNRRRRIRQIAEQRRMMKCYSPALAEQMVEEIAVSTLPSTLSAVEGRKPMCLPQNPPRCQPNESACTRL